MEVSFNLTSPGIKQFEDWQKYIECKSGIVFDINLIKLAVINVIESWTYLNLEQSLDCFKTYKGEWSMVLNDQVYNDLYNECLTLNNLEYDKN